MATPEAVAAAIQRLIGTRVLVGIPAGPDRADAGMSNAALGYIHEFGSPAQNIPARPFLAPGVKGSEKEWTEYLKRAALKALNAENSEAVTAEIDAELNKAGIVAVRAVQTRIRAGIPPPLSPKTISARRRRSKGSKYRRKAQSATQTTPLIDTGALLRSITHVVEKKR